MFIKTSGSITENKNLRQCESVFTDLIEDISVLGQIYVSTEELAHIHKLIRNNIDMLNNTPSFLKREAPIITSLFLLYTGLREYWEGNFLEPIYDKLDLKSESSKWNAILGDLFYHTLERYDLNQFEPGRNKYVNQILAQGMVPDNYLEEFFENFLYKECWDFLDILFTRKDVEKRLKNIRKDHEGHKKLRIGLSRVEKEIKKTKAKVENHRLTLDNYENLQKLSLLVDNKLNIDEIDELWQLPDNFLKKETEEMLELEREIGEHQKQIDRIRSREKEVKILIEKYEKQQHKIKKIEKKEETLQAKIRSLGGELLNRSWQKNDLSIVNELSLNNLAVKLKKYHSYYYYSKNKSGIKGVINYIKFLFRQKYFTLSGHRKKTENKIRTLLKDLPLIEQEPEIAAAKEKTEIKNLIFI